MSKFVDRCYDPDDLKKVQDILLEIMKDVLRICEENDLPVFMEGGTAIGAIRHKGFIPWDDDIDVSLLRKDYDRLMELLPEQLNERFGCDNWLDNKDFPAPNACVYAKDTVCVPIEMKNCKYRYGISIGVYAYDNVADGKFAAKSQAFFTWVLTRLHWLKVLPRPYITQKGFMRGLIYTVCTIAHYCLKIIPKKWIVKGCEHFYRKYNDRPTQKLNNFTSNDLEGTKIDRDEIFPLIESEFDGVKVDLLNGYDAILRRVYHGDYMQLPPVEKRKNHFPCELKFGDW